MSREKKLTHWLDSVLGTAHYQQVPLAGDASARRYFRVSVSNKRYVVMDAPPPESCDVFVQLAKQLKEGGLTVPTVIAADLEQGFLVLDDFGDQLYLDALNENTADSLYHAAFSALIKIQQCSIKVPFFDSALMLEQFSLFEKWYLHKHKGVTTIDSNLLSAVYEPLMRNITEQPQVLVHRDYHSRNLMLVESQGPGILDFQDAVIGPVTYDLVSLLQDCYISWPLEKTHAWVLLFQEQLQKAGLLEAGFSSAQFLKWFDWTGVQRHLKNLGIFARLHYRDNKSQYLHDIPRVLRYIESTCSRYNELLPLKKLIAEINEAVEV